MKNVHLNSLLRQTTIHLFLRVQSHLMFRGFSSNTYLTFLWLKYNINKLPSTMMATSSHFMPFHTMMVGPRCRLDYHSIFLGLAFGYRISFLFWKFDFDAKIYINLKFDKIALKIKNIRMLIITNVLHKHFVSQHKFWSQIPSYKKYSINHWHTIRH